MILVLTFLGSLLACGLYLRLARSWQILDRPNERSSHRNPTPHGGGVPLLLVFAVGFVASGPWPLELYWLFGGTMILMLVGVFDDVRGLPVKARFLLYTLMGAATAAVLLGFQSQSLTPLWAAQWLGASFAIVWALNLYNFMDGIDGIAATQCLMACLGAAFLANQHADAGAYGLICLLLGASTLGFLLWNWAPARLFLGDAGSIPLGFLLAGLAFYGSEREIVSLAAWAVMLAVFIGDASWTLAARLLAGENISQAHRRHGYQRLSRHWSSHQSVVLLLIGIQVFWLFPIAWVAHIYPDQGVYLVILAYFPIALGMAKIARLT